MADWFEDCPSRGAGLKHAHWSRCVPPNRHPEDVTSEYAGRIHRMDQCCHCEETIQSAQEAREGTVTPFSTPERPGTADHTFMPTIAGLCQRCGKPLVVHPTKVSEVSFRAEVGDCDHDSYDPWTRCQNCDVVVEPRMATGTVDGPKYGYGRGEATPRFLQRVVAFVGWAEWLGRRAS